MSMALNTSHVFISYASIDGSQIALKLYDDLKAHNTNAWLDKHDIKPGEDFYLSIEHAIKQARAIIVLLTPGSVLSVQVRGEWNYALNRYIPIIPLFIKNCDIPPILSILNFIDFSKSYNEGFNILVQRLLHLDKDYISYMKDLLDGFEIAQKTADLSEQERFQVNYTPPERWRLCEGD